MGGTAAALLLCLGARREHERIAGGVAIRFQDAVRVFADAVRAPLVSLGYDNDWADEQRIAEGPEAFARAMGAARAVVTNFFHGCVFSRTYPNSRSHISPSLRWSCRCGNMGVHLSSR